MFSFLRNNFIEIIEWIADDDDLVLWKFPDSDRNIKNGAQLVVRPSQVAIFVNEGQIADLFGPGRHVLRTENIPILTQLKGWKYGFDSPFKVDVYFVAVRDFLGLRWGTATPAYMFDTDLNTDIPIRANGEYVVQVTDPKKFIRKYAGTASTKEIGAIEDDLRSLIVDKFEQKIAHFEGTARKLHMSKAQFSTQILEAVKAEVAIWGISLSKFIMRGPSLPKEIQAKLNASIGDLQSHRAEINKAKMTSQEDMGMMNQLAQMEAMKKSAEKGNYENFQMAQNQMMMQQMMMQEMMQKRSGMGGHFQQPQQQAPQERKQSKEEIMSTLKQLGELKEMGILSQEEFNQKKQELLARLMG